MRKVVEVLPTRGLMRILLHTHVRCGRHRYQAIVDLTRKLNAVGSFRDTQVRTVGILVSLFPSWLLPAFKVRQPARARTRPPRAVGDVNTSHDAL